jgi:hypothetical protein
MTNDPIARIFEEGRRRQMKDVVALLQEIDGEPYEHQAKRIIKLFKEKGG